MTSRNTQHPNQNPPAQSGAGYQLGNDHHGNRDKIGDQNGNAKDRGNQQRNNQPSKGKRDRQG